MLIQWRCLCAKKIADTWKLTNHKKITKAPNREISMIHERINPAGGSSRHNEQWNVTESISKRKQVKENSITNYITHLTGIVYILPAGKLMPKYLMKERHSWIIKHLAKKWCWQYKKVRIWTTACLVVRFIVYFR